MDTSRTGIPRRLALVALAAMVALLLALAPRAAEAREYSIDAVNIDLTVNTDGSIGVVEDRAFDFDGSFNGVYWDIATRGPALSTSDEDPQVTALAVEDLTRGGGEFSQSDEGMPGTYEVTEYSSYTRVKIYTPHEDERATVRISYTMANVVNAWADTGELYWKFVSDGWDVSSNNVTCRVHLPVAAGESVVAGDNVRAWGHARSTPRLSLTATTSSTPSRALAPTSTPRPA